MTISISKFNNNDEVEVRKINSNLKIPNSNDSSLLGFGFFLLPLTIEIAIDFLQLLFNTFLTDVKLAFFEFGSEFAACL